MGHVITELVLLLVAVDGKRGDGRDVLVVAEGLESGGGESRAAEGKCQSESQRGIADLDVMKAVGLEDKISHPVGGEFKLVAGQQAPVIRRGFEASRWQSPFMHQVVGGLIQVETA